MGEIGTERECRSLPASQLMVAGCQPGSCEREMVLIRENVCGTYVHGVFDREDVAEAIVRDHWERRKVLMCLR